jgi:hypothetical protein
MTEEEKEIKLLKNIVKAQSRLLICYRIGSTKVPEWVFHTLDKATKKYGNDLSKII